MKRFYTITRFVEIDPGTIRVNQLYEGGTFHITKKGAVIVRLVWIDYGKFTGMRDQMSRKLFDKLLEEKTIKMTRIRENRKCS